MMTCLLAAASLGVSPLAPVVDAFWSRTGAPGVSVAGVTAEGQLVTACAGVADIESGLPMTVEHRLLAGSAGKTFWAAAALLLVADGTIELDAPIARWLGDEPWFDRLPNAADTTVRMLLNHTSGLPRYVMRPEFVAVAAAEIDRTWTAAERLEFVLDADPVFAAGAEWAYADTNYIVLGAVVEAATGAPFEAAVRRRVLDPLGSTDAVFSDRARLAGMATGYVDLERNLFHLEAPEVLRDGRFVYNVSFEWAGGGFATTPTALARWGRLLYAGDLIPEPIAREQRRGVAARLGGPDDSYGLGVMMRSGPGGRVLGHAGYMPGYLTDFAWFEGLGLGVAAQVNTTALTPELNPMSMRALLDECALAMDVDGRGRQ